VTRDEVANRMIDIFNMEIMEARKDGQREYTNGEDNAFSNFEQLAKELDLDREQILWVFAMKHKDGIASYLRGNKSQREDVTGRLKDLIVYLFLLWLMIEEGRSQDEEHLKRQAINAQRQMAQSHGFGSLGIGNVEGRTAYPDHEPEEVGTVQYYD
jgi:hypothetical protein